MWPSTDSPSPALLSPGVATLALTAAYFDDELAVETIADSDVSQAGLRLTFQLMVHHRSLRPSG